MTAWYRTGNVLLLAIALLGSAWADGGGGSVPESDDTDYVSAVAAIKRADYAAAIPLLERHTASQPTDANAWNWLGYANRKSGKLPAAFDSYAKAIKLDPAHRGAREYLGEAHLLAGNLGAAEEQLRILDRLCRLPCEERKDLAKAVAAYKSKRP